MEDRLAEPSVCLLAQAARLAEATCWAEASSPIEMGPLGIGLVCKVNN